MLRFRSFQIYNQIQIHKNLGIGVKGSFDVLVVEGLQFHSIGEIKDFLAFLCWEGLVSNAEST